MAWERGLYRVSDPVGNIHQLVTYDEPASEFAKPNRKGRPKGSKNKPKDTLSNVGLERNQPIIPTFAVVDMDDEDTRPEISTRWIHLLLKSEVVPKGLPMIINKWAINGVSKLPGGGASVVADVGGAHPMILTTLTPYDELAKLIEGISEF